MRSLPAGRSGKPEANPAGAPLLQLFWEVELYLRKRLAASQAGSLPPQVSFLMRSPCAQIPPAGGDPVDFENKDMGVKTLKSSGFRSIPPDSARTREAPCGFPQNPLYLFDNLYTMTDREKTDLLISCKKRKAADKLSSNLAKPVPSSIKNECLKVYREGKRPEGAMILQQFIKKGQHSDFAAAVEAIDIDRFRPTVRLLKEAGFKPEEKHYELLAWLLGPEPVISPGEEKKIGLLCWETLEK
ncbi:MAG: hypothetical protein JKY70_11705 [Mucilaginibacter sp.]|nr:hypothetical protein [Mucilaginibacter sp.]